MTQQETVDNNSAGAPWIKQLIFLEYEVKLFRAGTDTKWR